MKILSIDDHALFREGLELVLEQLDRNVELTHAGTIADGITALSSTSQAFDLVLTDLMLPGVTGIAALNAVRVAAPDVPTVVLAGSEDSETVRQAIDGGASGYIYKSMDSQELARALETILDGGIFLPAIALSSSTLPLSAPSEFDELTLRQKQVLKYLVKGLSNKQIGRELSISDETVKVHLKNIFRALGINNRTQAVYAIANFNLRID